MVETHVSVDTRFPFGASLPDQDLILKDLIVVTPLLEPEPATS